MPYMNDVQAKKSPPEKALQDFILDPDLEHLEDLLAEFNLFDVLRIARAELQHSAFLAWLLDPCSSHGLRDYFLRSFLLKAAEEARARAIGDITPLDVDAWRLSNVEVMTERHNIDILLISESDGFLCLIENKIGSGEHSNQLNHYLKKVEHEYAGLTPFPIFLTPDGIEPEADEDAERYVPIGYDRIATLIGQVLCNRGSTLSTSVASFLGQYQNALRRHVLASTNSIDDLASTNSIDDLAYRIYRKHQAAIDLIVKAKDTASVMDWEIIDTAVTQYAPDLKRDEHSKNNRRFFASSLECIPDIKEGQGWTSSKRILLFEFVYNQSEMSLSLILVIGPGKQEARQRLYDTAKQNGTPLNPVRKFAEKWNRVYRKNILPRNGYTPANGDDVEQRIGRAIQGFYGNDYWPIVNAIRSAFGLSPSSGPH